MKRIQLLIALCMAGSMAFAQSQRLVLFEEFTQASCPPCAATNPSLNAMLNQHPDQVVSIKYQTSWPGTDPMNAQNPTQVATRVTYYSVTGVPDGELDGGLGFSGQPASMTAGDVASRYALTSPFEIAVDFHLTPAKDSIYCHGIIRCTQAVTGTLVAHTVVIDRNVYYETAPGTNGEKEFEGVMRQMLPSASGTTLPSSWAVGDSMELNYSWKLPSYLVQTTSSGVDSTNYNQLALVIFVQNNATKEVLQAGYMAPQIANDCGVTAVANYSAVQCTPDITPDVTIYNYGNAALTSCDINYTVDGGTPSVYNWTGSVAPYGSATVTLPTITLSSGSHTVEIATSSPNANTDMNIHNDSRSIISTIYTSVVPSPVSEAFGSTVFPPSNFAVENVDQDDYTWVRSPYGLNGGGSAKMPFYDAVDGTVDNLYAPKFDFSQAIAGSTLTFDVAHAQYSATYIDHMKINVSSDCGANWTTVYDKQDPALASISTLYSSGAWNPSATQWRHETVSLDQFIGSSDLLVQFQGISGFGNNLFIDNVNISDGNVGVPVLLTEKGISLYPNPASGIAYLGLQLDQSSDVTVKMMNAVGAVVRTYTYSNVSNEVVKLDLSGLAKGSYLVQVQSGSSVVNKHLNITE